MADTVIRVEGLGKRYHLSHRQEGYVALRDVIAEQARSIGRRLLGRGAAPQEDGEEFWALRDVSFDLRRGEVLGVVGRNGAGKSTLLKTLSRITEPTEGRVRIGGRVASLLEVGTGFHPELTGRENVYLNGAILGMSRAEIRGKFDEIVAFAEIERFLDTPVKRYSSGMYVRLAFAVAAHLEPEILLVDEVLAVGDAAFQKKCLGKMHSVAAREQRSVIFVSHNMAAVTALTTRTILLGGGRVEKMGATADVVAFYGVALAQAPGASDAGSRGKHTRICAVDLFDQAGVRLRQYASGTPLTVEVEVETDGSPNLSLEIMLLDPDQGRLGLFSLWQFFGESLPARAGRYRVRVPLDGMWLAAGAYFMNVTTSVADVEWDHYVEHAARVEVPFSNPYGRTWDFRHSLGFGPLALRCKSTPSISTIGAQQAT
ncbi:MAG: ABC transporter ATP-binding protein [Burkholderiales bacterium]|nr:ABC transporter ATP-binding protein [Burkholderiales bacterium]